MPTADLFVRAHVLVDGAPKTGTVAVPPRPGPAPACTDAEVPTVALVRHLLARRSETGFRATRAQSTPRLSPTTSIDVAVTVQSSVAGERSTGERSAPVASPRPRRRRDRADPRRCRVGARWPPWRVPGSAGAPS